MKLSRKECVIHWRWNYTASKLSWYTIYIQHYINVSVLNIYHVRTTTIVPLAYLAAHLDFTKSKYCRDALLTLHTHLILTMFFTAMYVRQHFAWIVKTVGQWTYTKGDCIAIVDNCQDILSIQNFYESV